MVVVTAEAQALDCDYVFDVHARRTVYMLESILRHEQAVHDNREGECNLQRDEDRAGLVAPHRAQDGTNFHALLLLCLEVAGRCQLANTPSGVETGQDGGQDR